MKTKPALSFFCSTACLVAIALSSQTAKPSVITYAQKVSGKLANSGAPDAVAPKSLKSTPISEQSTPSVSPALSGSSALSGSPAPSGSPGSSATSVSSGPILHGTVEVQVFRDSNAKLKTPESSESPESKRTLKKNGKKSKKRIPDPTSVICNISPPVTVNKDGTKQKWVALTFDDGPSPQYTPKVLAILKSEGIKATFCLIGRQVKKYPELVKQIVAEGHTLADHTMNHDECLTRRSDKKLKTEILADKELIESVAPGASVAFFRAPGGNWNKHVRQTALAWGMKPLGWSVDTKDWQEPGVKQIIKTVNSELHPGAIILMHDAGGDREESVQALCQLIPQLRKAGYDFGLPQ